MKFGILVFILVITDQIFAQNKIKLYGTTFKSSEILGTNSNNGFGPRGVDYMTDLFADPFVSGTLTERLGQYYMKYDKSNTKKLLDLNPEKPLVFLDSINFAFYDEYALLKLSNTSEFKNDKKFKQFKKEFQSLGNNALKRLCLLEDSNQVYRNALENSRFYKQRVQGFTISTKMANAFKIGLTAKILQEVSSSGYSVDVIAGIKDTVNKYINVESGNYYEIILDKDYLRKAAMILKYLEENPAVLKSVNDDFTYEFRNFLRDENAAVVTGAALLSVTLDYSKYQQFKFSLGALIGAKINKDKGADIAADVTAAINNEKIRQVNVRVVETYFNIRYGWSERLELGSR